MATRAFAPRGRLSLRAALTRALLYYGHFALRCASLFPGSAFLLPPPVTFFAAVFFTALFSTRPGVSVFRLVLRAGALAARLVVRFPETVSWPPIAPSTASRAASANWRFPSRCATCSSSTGRQAWSSFAEKRFTVPLSAVAAEYLGGLAVVLTLAAAHSIRRRIKRRARGALTAPTADAGAQSGSGPH